MSRLLETDSRRVYKSRYLDQMGCTLVVRHRYIPVRDSVCTDFLWVSGVVLYEVSFAPVYVRLEMGGFIWE